MKRRGISKRRNATAETAAVTRRFAQQLAELRAERRETQKQLAARLGMTESMISRLEGGAHLPSLTTLNRIAAAFDRRLDITFHEHEHAHADGTRHAHGHAAEDFDHVHRHEPEAG